MVSISYWLNTKISLKNHHSCCCHHHHHHPTPNSLPRLALRTHHKRTCLTHQPQGWVSSSPLGGTPPCLRFIHTFYGTAHKTTGLGGTSGLGASGPISAAIEKHIYQPCLLSRTAFLYSSAAFGVLLTSGRCTEEVGVRDQNPNASFLNGLGFLLGKPHYNSGPINLKKALYLRKGSPSACSARCLNPRIRIPACVWLKALPQTAHISCDTSGTRQP